MSSEVTDPLHDLLRFHRRIRLSIRTFIRVAEAAKKGVEPNQVEMRALIEFFTGPLIWHDIDEEVTLLPRLRKESDPELVKTMREMTRQHEQMEELLEGILPHLTDVATGQAPANGELLLTEATALNDLLAEHLRLEEQEVFPLARKVLSKEDLEEMAVEMSTRLDSNKHKLPRVVSLSEGKNESVGGDAA